MINKYMLFAILLIMPFSGAVCARVFRCESAIGNTTYQDRPCSSIGAQPKRSLSLAKKHLGAKELSRKKQSKKIILQQQRRKDLQLKELYRRERERKREHKRWAQEQQISKTQAERAQHKCDGIKLKRKAAQKRLQAEYTNKQKIGLNEGLDYYKHLQKRYCRR